MMCTETIFFHFISTKEKNVSDKRTFFLFAWFTKKNVIKKKYWLQKHETTLVEENNVEGGTSNS